jgi:hypothetical protein
MNMPCPGLALRLLAHGDAFGVREELIGDLLEEIDRGRSQLWVCQQLIGLCRFAVVGHVRHRTRLTPQAVALALSIVLLAGLSMTSVSRVLEAWLGFYYVTGALTLFAHMASRTAGRGRVVPAGAEPS